jgi:DNA replication and repair protein RecF
MPLSLYKLNLSQFRGYEAARLEVGGAQMVVLTGDNGAGKTNILEAVSLLVAGKGLRNADLIDMKNRTAGAEDVWAIAAEVETATGISVRIGTGLDRSKDSLKHRRIIRINGKDVKTQGELSGFISAVWLTPQMDRLFLEGSAARRKFFDRLVFSFAPDHITRLNRYEKQIRERMRILQASMPADPLWLAGVENQLAGDAVAIAAQRLHVLEHLGHYGAKLKAEQSLFPVPLLSMEGWVENALLQSPALAVEEALKIRFAQSRGLDKETGRSHEGIHRSDLKVIYADKNMPAAQCSTGEQKGLLVAIVLAHALMMQAEKGFVPLILLDEVAAHLDAARRQQLFGYLASFHSQVWLTGTDAATFAPLSSCARFFNIHHGKIT